MIAALLAWMRLSWGALLPLCALMAACSLAACGPKLWHHWSLYYPVVVEVEFEGERVKWDFDARCEYRSEASPDAPLSGTELLRRAKSVGRMLKNGGALFMAVPNMCDRPFALTSDYSSKTRPTIRQIVDTRNITAPIDYVPFMWWYDQLPHWNNAEYFVSGAPYGSGGRVTLLNVEIGPMSFARRKGAVVLDHLDHQADVVDPTNRQRFAWGDVGGTSSTIAGRSRTLGREFDVPREAGYECGLGVVAIALPIDLASQQEWFRNWLKLASKSNPAEIPDSAKIRWHAPGIRDGEFRLLPPELDKGWNYAVATGYNPVFGWGVPSKTLQPLASYSGKRSSALGLASSRQVGANGLNVGALPMYKNMMRMDCNANGCTPNFSAPGVVPVRRVGTCEAERTATLIWRGKTFHADLMASLTGKEPTLPLPWTRETQLYDPQTKSVWVFRSLLTGVEPW